MIDYSLPRITLPNLTPDACRMKYQEELREWQREPEDSFERLVEAWDVIQVCQTWLTNGGGYEASICCFKAKGVIRGYLAMGRDVVSARQECLRKNALRSYYSPEDCLRILAGG